MQPESRTLRWKSTSSSRDPRFNGKKTETRRVSGSSEPRGDGLTTAAAVRHPRPAPKNTRGRCLS